MRALVLEENTLNRLREYAELNRITWEQCLKMVAGEFSPGDDPNYTAIIPVGYRVVFTIEQQEQKNGKKIWCRHASVSVDTPKKLPNEAAFDAIIAKLGFKGKVATHNQNCLIWIENVSPELSAINIVEEYDE